MVRGANWVETRLDAEGAMQRVEAGDTRFGIMISMLGAMHWRVGALDAYRGL